MSRKVVPKLCARNFGYNAKPKDAGDCPKQTRRRTSLRKVVFDTETTGLDPSVHRVINLAGVELIDNIPTGKFIQFYLNPDRESDPRALQIHGLTTEFLRDKPRFGDIRQQFQDFIGGDPLIIHNAEFDVRFMNTELRRLGQPSLVNRTVCTKCVAQKKFGGPGGGTGTRYRGGNKLDDLVRKFGVEDLRARFGVHGALIDCLLLVNVYRALYDAPIYNLDLAAFGIEPSESTSVTSKAVGDTGRSGVPEGTEVQLVSCDAGSISEGDGYVVSGNSALPNSFANG